MTRPGSPGDEVVPSSDAGRKYGTSAHRPPEVTKFFDPFESPLKMEEGEKSTLLQDQEIAASNAGVTEGNGRSSFLQCKVYKRRWYVLFIFTLTSVVSNLMWNTWGPIQRPCRLVFGWERWTILLLSSLGAIGPILGAFPSTWLMDTKGEPFLFCSPRGGGGGGGLPYKSDGCARRMF